MNVGGMEVDFVFEICLLNEGFLFDFSDEQPKIDPAICGNGVASPLDDLCGYIAT